jgi:Zn-dependent peptidase ImmA (M78 family)
MIRHEHLGRGVPDYNLVMGKVAKVLKDNYVSEPPISPREIASNYGIETMFADFDQANADVAGFLYLKDKEIFVNNQDHPNRQTFTIAHELGHAMLHADLYTKYPEEYKVLLRRPIGADKDPLEQEANAFAAHLLVPKFMLSKYGRIASPSELSRLFNVSDDVIRFRIAYESKYAKTWA